MEDQTKPPNTQNGQPNEPNAQGGPSGRSSSEPKLQGVWISDTAIRQPVFVVMLMLFTVVVGLLSYTRLPVDQLPEINPPVITVSIPYPGSGPESVADQVAEVVEDEISTLNGVETITTNSSEGIMAAIIEFEQDVDADQALQEVRDAVESIRPQLPSGIEEPVFSQFDPAQRPVLSLAIVSNTGKDVQQLRQRIEDEIVPLVQRAQGVGSTTVSGGLEEQINVELDLNRLTALRILPSQVSQAIRNANTDIGLGDVGVSEELEANLRAPSIIQDPADIPAIGIAGTNYDIGDVATVTASFAEVDAYSRLNGEDAITLDIRKQSGTNTVAVVDAAIEELDAVFAINEDLRYEITSNQAVEVRQDVNGSIEEIIISVVFALLIVLLFFRNVRATLVTGSGLPVVLLGTFAAIAAMGLTINVMTLLALSVSVGLIIDDAIVVRENIFRYAERGLPPKIAASEGIAEVALAVVAMTLTIVAVFLPVAFTSGVAGIIFGSFGLTIVAAMLLSLVESFTLAPMLSAHLFPQKKRKDNKPIVLPSERKDDAQSALAELEEEQSGFFSRIYERILRFSLRFRFVPIILGLCVVGASFFAAGGIQVAFFPQNDSGEFAIGFSMPPGTPLDITDEVAREAEAILLADPDIDLVVTTVGGSGSALTGSRGAEDAEFLVQLRNPEDDIPPPEGPVEAVGRYFESFFARLLQQEERISSDEVKTRLREQMSPEQFPEIAFAIDGFGGASTAVTSRPIQAEVRTTGSLDELAPVIAQMRAAVDNIPGLTDVDTTYTPGKPEIQFLVYPDRADDFGLTNDDVARTIQALVDGDTAAIYRSGSTETDIVVRLEPEDRQSVGDLTALRIPINGAMVPLTNVAAIELDTSTTSIRRVNREVEVIIGGNNTGRNINEVQTEMQTALATVPLPDNVTLRFGGDTEDQAESFITILIAMALSVLFVYMVLASQFGSFLQPLVIMLAMPFSFLGAFFALSITGVELTVFGMIGMILMLGLVTKNSILLVDFINRLYRGGLPKNEAIIRAGGVRLRPIAMTAIAILMANLPAALGLGEGAELRQGLATIVIGGLVTSTVLTLLFVPVAYSLLESIIRRTKQFFGWIGRLIWQLFAAMRPKTTRVTVDSTSERREIADANGEYRDHGATAQLTNGNQGNVHDHDYREPAHTTNGDGNSVSVTTEEANREQ